LLWQRPWARAQPSCSQLGLGSSVAPLGFSGMRNAPVANTDQASDQAAQGSGGVPIPGGVQKTCRCGTSGHGLAGVVGLG